MTWLGLICVLRIRKINFGFASHRITLHYILLHCRPTVIKSNLREKERKKNQKPTTKITKLRRRRSEPRSEENYKLTALSKAFAMNERSQNKRMRLRLNELKWSERKNEMNLLKKKTEKNRKKQRAITLWLENETYNLNVYNNITKTQIRRS